MVDAFRQILARPDDPDNPADEYGVVPPVAIRDQGPNFTERFNEKIFVPLRDSSLKMMETFILDTEQLRERAQKDYIDAALNDEQVSFFLFWFQQHVLTNFFPACREARIRRTIH